MKVIMAVRKKPDGTESWDEMESLMTWGLMSHVKPYGVNRLFGIISQKSSLLSDKHHQTLR